MRCTKFVILIGSFFIFKKSCTIKCKNGMNKIVDIDNQNRFEMEKMENFVFMHPESCQRYRQKYTSSYNSVGYEIFLFFI